MPELTCVISEFQIQTRLEEIADEISRDYQGLDLVLVGVLKGAFIFMADIVRKITTPFTIDFVSVSSYGSSTTSSGNIRLLLPITANVTGKHILLIEDIVDTGQTLKYLTNQILSIGAASVNICALIDKKERRTCDIPIRYACHHIHAGFLVGYGLDYAENYRGLSAIYHLQL
jgi:hypoxanthine phosphoribosyltransferase